jgi:hypothetical protein
MWPTLIGYASSTLAKNHGTKCNAIENILGNTLGTSEEPNLGKSNPSTPPPFSQAKLWRWVSTSVVHVNGLGLTLSVSVKIKKLYSFTQFDKTM